MARRITEERLTKQLLNWLEENDWTIICFDFPQSGTGYVLHTNQKEDKTKGAIIPDIVAIKEGIVVFFENKDRFVKADYYKVEYLRTTTDYSEAIAKLLTDFDYQTIYYGIAIPWSELNIVKDEKHQMFADFTLMVADGTIEIIFDPNQIF